MKPRNTVFRISLVVVGMLAGLAVTRAQTGAKPDTVAAITKLENDAVKADLANDKTFYEKVLADDWTGGGSGGGWFTKNEELEINAAPGDNKKNKEKKYAHKDRGYAKTSRATPHETA